MTIHFLSRENCTRRGEVARNYFFPAIHQAGERRHNFSSLGLRICLLNYQCLEYEIFVWAFERTKQGHVRRMNVDEIFFYLWMNFLFIFFVWLDEEKIQKNLSFFILLVDALCQINHFKERRKKQIHPSDIFRNEKFQNFRR